MIFSLIFSLLTASQQTAALLGKSLEAVYPAGEESFDWNLATLLMPCSLVRSVRHDLRALRREIVASVRS